MSIWQRIGVLTLVPLLLISLLRQIALAQDTYSANAHLPGCKLAAQDPRTLSSNRELIDAMNCIGFISAAREYTVLARDPFRACTPISAKNGEIALVIVKFLESRPSRLHESFALLVAEALQTAWPCKN
jgi:Ssp1 endopeptidase immunity protein Rap1a